MTRLMCRRRRGFTLVELLVIVLIVVMCGAFLISCRREMDDGYGRVKCASNLRQIGQAIQMYCKENNGAYPRTRATTGPSVIPTWGTGAAATNPFADNGPQPNDVSAALFLLLRTEDLTSDVFVCPKSNADRDDFGGGGNTALNRSNFSDIHRNLSYSYQNPYPNDGALKRGWKLDSSLTAEYPVAADINPGTVGTNQNVLAVRVTSDTWQIRQGNSANHAGDGQNVLYADGHVEWQQNPFVGANRDNIYTASDGKGGQTVVASPYDLNDSVLLPTDD